MSRRVIKREERRVRGQMRGGGVKKVKGSGGDKEGKRRGGEGGGRSWKQ